jgi:hypothetical protein
LFTKPVIFVVTSFVLSALIYSSSPTFLPHVQGKPIAGGHIECDSDFFSVTCCWWEDFGDYIAYVCQSCDEDGSNCGPIVKTDPSSLEQTPTPPMTPGGGANVPQDGGVLEQPPVSPPRNDANVPHDGGVLEQPPTPTPPPLFGGNDVLSFGQPTITPPTTQTPTRLPGGGTNVPLQGGIAEQPTTTPPTPFPPTPGPLFAPEDNQDDANEGGGGRPPLKSDESLPFSEGGGGGQGEAEQPSDDGQNPTIIE